MKLFSVFSLTALVAAYSQVALAWEDVGDMLTHIDRDCILVSQSTDEVDEKFKELECKAFGGFQLKISGAEDRISPKLNFSGFDITLKDPDGPHDMATNTIQWIYSREYYPSGEGRLTWLGMVYALKVGSDIQHYGVRLDKRMSCVVVISSDASEAADEILDPSTPCLHY